MTPGDGVAGPAPSALRHNLQLALLAVLTVAVLAAVWLAVDILRVRAAINDAKQQTEDLTTQLKIVGPGGESGIAKQIAHDVEHARGITHGFAWSMGRKLPFVGDDFTVVTEAADAIAPIVTEGVPALTKISNDRDTGELGLSHGRIDLSVLRRLTPTITDASAVFTRGTEQFDAIDLDKAHGPVTHALAGVGEKLDQAQSLLETGSKALTLAPGMLGENGKRTYLLIFQNNAELRSTGGIPGAYAELVVNNGRLTIGRQGSGADTGYFDPPAVTSTKDERSLYGTLSANFWNDSNFSPDFPRTAEILRAMYNIRFHKQLDGIISVDPIALAHVLVATGPVQVTKDVKVDAGSVVPILLNAVYQRYPDDDPAQNAFFASAAKRIFESFITGGGDPATLLQELNTAVSENRVLVNATRPDEQSVLDGTRLAGALPDQPGTTPNIGLYINDSSAAKLEFYLDRATVVSPISCSSDGVQTFLSNTVLASTAPKNVVSLGHGVVGFTNGAKRGEMSMVLSYYAPFGGRVTKVVVDGEEQSVNKASDHGLEVATVPVKLLPGAQQTVTVTIESGPDQRDDAVFRTTPGVQPTPNNVKVKSSC